MALDFSSYCTEIAKARKNIKRDSFQDEKEKRVLFSS